MKCQAEGGCSQDAERDGECYYHAKRSDDLILDPNATAPGRWPSIQSLERERARKVRRRAREFDRLVRRQTAKEEAG